MKVNIGGWATKSSRRKINIQIHDYDTWNLDHTLANIILPALLQLKATKHGVPSEFCEVGGEDWAEQDSFEFYKETHDEAWTIGAARWDTVLDKMIWSFEQLSIGDSDSKYHHGTIKTSWEESDKQFPNPISGKMEKTFTMKDENPEEHWYDAEGHKLHEERIQEGLDLFGKHYRSLWD